MFGLGLILLIIGTVVLVIAYTTKGPAPLHPIGWACMAIGAVLLIVGLLAPMLLLR